VNKKYGDEAKIAMGFQEQMKRVGAKCYPELDRCDLVVKQENGEIWAVEAKALVNLKVFAQAWAHRTHAHRLYVVLPRREFYRDSEGHAHAHFVRELCSRFGIGLYTVGFPYQHRKTWDEWSPGMPVPVCDVQEEITGTLFERTELSWDRLMIPEAETFSVAGGSGVKAFTDFRLWEIEVVKFVKGNPGLTCEGILRVLRPPGVHKRTGKPLVVLKQDQEILWYNIKNRFTGLYTKTNPENTSFLASTIWSLEDYYKGIK
jgi:hypothetical protein